MRFFIMLAILLAVGPAWAADNMPHQLETLFDHALPVTKPGGVAPQGKITVHPAGEGWTVKLPPTRLNVGLAKQFLLLKNVSLFVEPAENGDYAVTASLPQQLPIVGSQGQVRGALQFKNPTLNGRWNKDLSAWRTLNISAANAHWQDTVSATDVSLDNLTLNLRQAASQNNPSPSSLITARGQADKIRFFPKGSQAIELDKTNLTSQFILDAKAARGMIGDVDLTVRGLDDATTQLRDLSKQPEQKHLVGTYIALSMVKLIAGTPRKDGDVQNYKFSLLPNGKLTLNGMDISPIEAALNKQAQPAKK